MSSVTCYFCSDRAEFTVDWPADGYDVCGRHLAAACYETAQHGHEWPNVFAGQYPRFLKVTPIFEDLPAEVRS